MKQSYSLAILSVTMLALVGCGGGSGTTPPDINVIDGLMDSVKPVYAEAGKASYTGTEFGTVTSSFVRTYGDTPSVSLPDSSGPHVASVTPMTDDAHDVVFMVNGKEVPISFTGAELSSDFPKNTKTTEGTIFEPGGDLDGYQAGTEEGFLHRDNPLDKDYYSLAYWGVYLRDAPNYPDYNGYVVFGPRTNPASFPTTASYSGYFLGSYMANDGDTPLWRTHRHNLWGQLKLTADFDNLMISGTVDDMSMQAPEDEGDPENRGGRWTELPDTTSITIAKSPIVQGRYITTWTGQDTNANNSMDTSARGFSGQMVGDFYGPNAEETAGVFNGSRDNNGTSESMYGVFGAQTAPLQ